MNTINKTLKALFMKIKDLFSIDIIHHLKGRKIAPFNSGDAELVDNYIKFNSSVGSSAVYDMIRQYPLSDLSRGWDLHQSYEENMTEIKNSGLNQDMVIHRSQIETVCEKLKLKFVKKGSTRISVGVETLINLVNFNKEFSRKMSENDLYILSTMRSVGGRITKDRLANEPNVAFLRINADFYYILSPPTTRFSIFRWIIGFILNKPFKAFFSSIVLSSLFLLIFGFPLFEAIFLSVIFCLMMTPVVLSYFLLTDTDLGEPDFNP